MRPSKRRALATAAVLFGAVLMPVVSAGPAAAAPFACNENPGDKDDSTWSKSAKENVNQRSGPSTGCASKGIATPNHKLDYHCYKSDSGGYSWTYVRNDSTGVKGWIRDDNLRGGGSVVHC